VQLVFFLLANKHPTSYEDVFRHTVLETAKRGVNFFPTTVYADFETAIHNKVTTVWSRLEVKSCHFHLRQLVAENTTFGTQQAVGKERLCRKSVLEENIRTVAFTTGGILRPLCVGIFIQCSK